MQFYAGPLRGFGGPVAKPKDEAEWSEQKIFATTPFRFASFRSHFL